jgi:SWI/SNF-related matrix-associated actin-dependent regulator 1 of chromatin subfamily A
MEYRSVTLGARVRGALVLAIAATALVGEASAADAQTAAKHQRADQLETEARVLRLDAERTFKAEQAACHSRFLVNDCIKAAKEARLQKIIEARRKESERATLEREIRYAELAARRDAKLRQRAEDGPPPAVVTQPDRAPVEAKPLQ